MILQFRQKIWVVLVQHGQNFNFDVCIKALGQTCDIFNSFRVILAELTANLFTSTVVLSLGPLQTVKHPIPMSIVRPVLIFEALRISLIFCKQVVRSKLFRQISWKLKIKQIPIALKIKTSLIIGHRDWVSHLLFISSSFSAPCSPFLSL